MAFLQSLPNPPGWSSTGLPPASGVSGVAGPYCDEWYIETQTLHYQYERVPVGMVSSVQMGLSAVTLSPELEETQFIFHAVTYNEATSSNGDCYATSSYVQPQQFQIHSESTDRFGMSYGDVDAGEYGPRGAILTFKPYVYRRPIVHGVDELYQAWNQGNNHGTTTVQSQIACSDWVFPFTTNHWQGGIWWELFSNATAFGISNEGFCGMLQRKFLGTSFNRKLGTYSTGQDTLTDVQVVTDKIGRTMITPMDTNNFTILRQAGNNIPTPPNPYYDVTRHYWA